MSDRKLRPNGDIAMIFRLLQKLSGKIKPGALSALPMHENPFADWSAHLIVAGRTQYVLLSNAKSLYSTLMYGKGITNDNHLITRALNSIREFMQDEGQEFSYQRLIVPACSSVRFAKALNRSVTGSMNDLVYHATVWLTEASLSPHDVGFKLNDIPFSPLGGRNSEHYYKPREAFKELTSAEIK